MGWFRIGLEGCILSVLRYLEDVARRDACTYDILVYVNTEDPSQCGYTLDSHGKEKAWTSSSSTCTNPATAFLARAISHAECN